MSIGENIKRIRLEKGLTQKQLGEKLGKISQQQIGQWETGKANPKLETQKKIAKALKVPVSAINNDLNVFDEIIDEDTLNCVTNSLINDIRNIRKQELISAFDSLNSRGHIEAVKRIQELTEIPRYTIKEEPPAE